MSLTNAERQKLWRERHKDHVRVPVKAREAHEKIEVALIKAMQEIAALRLRVAELTGAPRPLRLPAEMAADAEPNDVERRLHHLCRCLGYWWLDILRFLFDHAGPEATSQAIRRYLAAIEAKDKAKATAALAKLERRRACEAAKAAKSSRYAVTNNCHEPVRSLP